jgi:ribonuclease VapC
MIAVDTSVFAAIAFREPECDRLRAVLMSAERFVTSSATLVEARIVLYRKGGTRMVEELDQIVMAARIEIVPVDRDQADIAHTAFTRFGKGTGHPAQLNFGDLFAYALAKSRNIPLLFKGADFAATDVIAAA